MKQLTLFALWFCGCGGLQNEPLRYGTLRGQLEQADSRSAVVSVMGIPELRASVDAWGAFELARVPIGEVELFAVASTSRALRLATQVSGGQVTHLGALSPELGGQFDVEVKVPIGRSVAGGTAQVSGTVIGPDALDSDGDVVLGPLPVGCYRVEVNVPGFQPAASESCIDFPATYQMDISLVLRSSGDG